MATKNMRETKSDRVFNFVNISICAIIVFVVAYPIWVVLISSVSDPFALMAGKVWILPVGFDKTYLMQNPTNLEISQVLSTYEYSIGIGGGIPSYSYPAAIGLWSAAVSFLLICVTNKISKVLSDTGLW